VEQSTYTPHLSTVVGDLPAASQDVSVSVEVYMMAVISCSCSMYGYVIMFQVLLLGTTTTLSPLKTYMMLSAQCWKA